MTEPVLTQAPPGLAVAYVDRPALQAITVTRDELAQIATAGDQESIFFGSMTSAAGIAVGLGACALTVDAAKHPITFALFAVGGAFATALSALSLVLWILQRGVRKRRLSELFASAK